MSFGPYIHVQGNCRTAMTRYQQILGGTLTIMDWADAPDASADMRASGLVMHAALKLGGRAIFTGDFPPGMAGDPQAGFSISHNISITDGASPTGRGGSLTRCRMAAR